MQALQFSGLYRVKTLRRVLALTTCLPALLQGQSFAPESSAGAIACVPNFEPAATVTEVARQTFPDNGSALAAEIGTIHYTRLPIFDERLPEEDIRLFRWANRFHLMTREATISQQLLFEEGDRYSPRLLQESARILRSQGYFYDVAIRPVSHCADRVDVEIVTKDTWSLTPNLVFDRAGGENSFSAGLRDSNFLGLGQLLSISSSRDIDRRSTELHYQDNNVFGTRLRNNTRFTDSDDGFQQQFDVDLPFFALQSEHAWALRLNRQELQAEQFRRGEEVSSVTQETEDYALEIGLSKGLQQGLVRRWRFGLRHRRHRFSDGDNYPPPAVFPVDQTLVYPYLDYELLQYDFVTAFNLDQIFRTEDLHLGHSLRFGLGYAEEGLGSDVDRVVLEGRYSKALLYDGDRLWQHHLEWEGFWNRARSAAEDVLISYENRYFHRQTDSRAFFARFHAQFSKNLNGHRQVVLGGATGARAFDNRFQTGDRMFLLSLEERIYTDYHLLNLIRVGGAVFADVGRAWTPAQPSPTADKLLTNIGFGLRLASSKAASDRIAHLDFAFPLSNQNDPAVDSVLIAFTIKGHF